MKIKTLIPIFISLILMTILFANQGKDVVGSFESIINKVDEFLSTSPVVLISEDFRSSPSGRINYLLKFEKLNLAYDIQKTDSLVSPYTGYIVVSLKVESNAEYGDIISKRLNIKTMEDDEYNWGFQYAEDAEEVERFAKCVSEPEYSEIQWCCGDVKLLYAYQGGKWVFKGVNTEGPNRIDSGTVRWGVKKTILENPEWQEIVK
jgi:hypothetical protein